MSLYIGADDLQAGLPEILAAPAAEGTVELVVRRPTEGEREALDEGERGAFRRTVTFARDAFAIAGARRHVGKKLRSERPKRSAVHGSPETLTVTPPTGRTTDLSSGFGDRWA